jgi:nucleoid-associated protein YgaU
MDSLKKIILVTVVLAVGLGAAMMFRKPRGTQPPAEPVPSRVTFRDDAGVQKVQDGSADAAPRQGVPLPPELQAEPQQVERPLPVAAPELPAIRVTESVAPVAPPMEPLEPPVMPRQPRLHDDPVPRIPAAFDRLTRPELPSLGEEEMERRRFSNTNPTPPAPRREPATAHVAVSSPLPARVEPPAMRVHVISNGDTLTRLAQRYLGNENRYREIYDLNRNVLDSPEVLPLGVKLKIPAKEETAAAETTPVLPSTSQILSPPPSPPLVPLPTDAFFRGR